MIRAALLALALVATGAEAAPCRQALALGLDVSGSVDAQEYRLQLDGLAAALLHPEVREAFLADPGAPVWLAVYEWSGPSDQRLLQPWTPIDTPATLEGVAGRLAGTLRAKADPSTAIGEALELGRQLLSDRAECPKRVLDLSGDGIANTGRHPRDVKKGLPDWLVVNGLVISSETNDDSFQSRMTTASLGGYYRTYVLHGLGAFLETALGFEDFEAAMVRKLKKELSVLILGSLDPVAPGPWIKTIANPTPWSDR
ncbi:DUF1194 domain-containing protein [Mesobacterium pallidum]|uniref:DUF1194 domain-containing protein n=1 Tax=Mesobacterium pallidum TaxID=2872037 RepID=UPI001EE35ABF|nr:DUF1194 domain-containing protein [Mesobacterium pallidum]